MKGFSGVRRTTGQHPGGLMVVPAGREIYEFTPIQYPANDRGSEVMTTHFDYEAIHDHLVKLDMLGHDGPTVLRMLEDLTGVGPDRNPLGRSGTMKIFSGVDALGISPQDAAARWAPWACPSTARASSVRCWPRPGRRRSPTWCASWGFPTARTCG